MTFLMWQRQRAGSHTKMKTAKVNLMAKLEHRLVDTVAILRGYKNTVQQRLAADLCYPSYLRHAKYTPKSKKERSKERKKQTTKIYKTQKTPIARACARTHTHARIYTHTLSPSFFLSECGTKMLLCLASCTLSFFYFKSFHSRLIQR